MMDDWELLDELRVAIGRKPRSLDDILSACATVVAETIAMASATEQETQSLLATVKAAEMFQPVCADARFVARPIRPTLLAVARSLRSAQGGHHACRGTLWFAVSRKHLPLDRVDLRRRSTMPDDVFKHQTITADIRKPLAARNDSNAMAAFLEAGCIERPDDACAINYYLHRCLRVFARLTATVFDRIVGFGVTGPTTPSAGQPQRPPRRRRLPLWRVRRSHGAKPACRENAPASAARSACARRRAWRAS